ncbi:hypothetical protein ACSNOI_17565 [Actinomadura kijaniata]|uniref:hypothetical protein n=1 Tax=Actinomadura kijaniata TaxID=46161 RepID=UPI003F1C503C
MSAEIDWLFQAVCVETGGPDAAPHALSPRFRNRTVARRWLGNYLTYSADNLQRDGDQLQAAAFRTAAVRARTDGQAVIGTVHYRVRQVPNGQWPFGT